jgi:hypothetical protein
LELKDHPESTVDANVIDVIDKVFSNFKATTMELLALQMHLLSTLRVLRGKQENMLTWGVANLAHPTTITLFPYATSDNALKRHRRLLEPLEEICKSMTPSMTDFVVIPDIYDLEALSCNR